MNIDRGQASSSCWGLTDGPTLRASQQEEEMGPRQPTHSPRADSHTEGGGGRGDVQRGVGEGRRQEGDGIWVVPEGLL